MPLCVQALHRGNKISCIKIPYSALNVVMRNPLAIHKCRNKVKKSSFGIFRAVCNSVDNTTQKFPRLSSPDTEKQSHLSTANTYQCPHNNRSALPVLTVFPVLFCPKKPLTWLKCCSRRHRQCGSALRANEQNKNHSYFGGTCFKFISMFCSCVN